MSADEQPITRVAISGLVVLKLTSHCTSNMPALVTGQLLGLDVDSTLEVTDCFPFPVRFAARSLPPRHLARAPLPQHCILLSILCIIRSKLPVNMKYKS